MLKKNKNMNMRRKCVQMSAFILLFVVASSTLLLNTASAAIATISVRPSSQTVQVGAMFTVDLRVDPGTSVNMVEANVNFDPAQLGYINIDTSSSAFPDQLAQSVSSGTINFQRSVGVGGNDVSSDARVAIMTFRALTSGSASLTISGADSHNDAGSLINLSPFNTVVTVSVPACPSGQTGTPPNCVTPVAPTTPTPTPPTPTTPTAPTATPVPPTSPKTCPSGQTGTPPNCKAVPITPKTGGATSANPVATTTPPTTTVPATSANDAKPVIGSQNVQFTQAVITTTSKAPTQVYIDYGTSSEALSLQTPLSELGTSHKVSLDATRLTPGQTYYYVVVSKDQQGNTAQTTMESFTTKGISVTIKVFDSNHKPVTNKAVVLHSVAYNATTNDKGVATFNNVAPGAHELTYAVGDKTYSQNLAVSNTIKTATDGTQTAAAQNVSVVLAFSQKSGSVAAIWIMAIVLLVIIGFGVFFLLSRKFRKAAARAPLKSEPVIVASHDDDVVAAPLPLPSPPLPPPSPPLTPQAQAVESIAAPLNNVREPEKPEPGSTVAPFIQTPVISPVAQPVVERPIAVVAQQPMSNQPLDSDGEDEPGA